MTHLLCKLEKLLVLSYIHVKHEYVKNFVKFELLMHSSKYTLK